MSHIKVWAKQFTRKSDGGKFTKISVKGAGIPLAEISHSEPVKKEAYYDVRLVNTVTDREGEYQVYFERGFINDKGVLVLMNADKSPLAFEYLRKPSKVAAKPEAK